MDAQITIWDIFNTKDGVAYPEQKIKFHELQGEFVEDAVSSKNIWEWNRTVPGNNINYRAPVVISAQTGKGKNHFVTYTLREYAKRKREEILYVSNRIALDYQQKKELAELTGETLFSDNDQRWTNKETFSNVTVLTYKKLMNRLWESASKEVMQWANQFRYVVLDECHFFYSDALFNPYTWRILERIIFAFQNSVRIYMSATPEDVLEPIRYLEGTLLKNATGECPEEIDKYVHAYFFPRDFSKYKPFFFSDWEQLLPKVVEKGFQDKWLIFVTSKEKGKQYRESVLGDKKYKRSKCDNIAVQNEVVTYIDSSSRDSKVYEDKYAWDYIQENGKFQSKVLITTSVIDNGFSIHDPAVKNIVLFTHDRTEFLQELGRCRLNKGQMINLYIQKLTPTAHSRRKAQFEKYNRFLENAFGDGSDFKQGNLPATVRNLWNAEEEPLRGCVSWDEVENGLFKPHINEMARWRIKLLGDQIHEYEDLEKSYSKNASVLYKAEWIKEGPSEIEDLDVSKHEQAVEELRDFLDEIVNAGAVLEASSEFNNFSVRFSKLFKMVDPQNSAINRGMNRKPMGKRAIRNRLEELGAYGLYYQLEELEINENGKMIRIVALKSGSQLS